MGRPANAERSWNVAAKPLLQAGDQMIDNPNEMDAMVNQLPPLPWEAEPPATG